MRLQFLFNLILLNIVHVYSTDIDIVANDIVKRIGALEERGKTQDLLIKDLQDEIIKLQRDNAEMQRNTYQSSENAESYHNVKTANIKKEKESSTLKIVKRSPNSSNLPFTNITAVYPEDVLQEAAITGRVAFHATIDKNTNYPYAVSHLTIGQVIVFDQVKVNIGNGYHSSTGLFIAPLLGIYMFSASVMTKGEIQLNIVKNGEPKAGLFASDRQQGSVTMVTELQAGDEIFVKVQSPDDAYLWGDRLTSFSGCLII